MAGIIHQHAQAAPLQVAHRQHRHLGIHRPLHAQGVRALEGAVGPGRPVAHQDAPVVADFEIEDRCKAHHRAAPRLQGRLEYGHRLPHQRLDIRFVARHVPDGRHRRPGVVVRRHHHDPAAREPGRRLDPLAQVVHLRPADAQQVELDKGNPLLPLLQDRGAGEQRILNRLADNVLEPADLVRAHRGRDVDFSKSRFHGAPFFRISSGVRLLYRMWERGLP